MPTHWFADRHLRGHPWKSDLETGTAGPAGCNATPHRRRGSGTTGASGAWRKESNIRVDILCEPVLPSGWRNTCAAHRGQPMAF